MQPLSPLLFQPHLLIDGFTLDHERIQRLWSANDAVFNCVECDAMPGQKISANLLHFGGYLQDD